MSSDTRVPLSSVAEIVSVKVPVSSLGGHLMFRLRTCCQIWVDWVREHCQTLTG
jgi:hypothetical protein